MKDNSKQPIKDIIWKSEYCYTSDDFMLIPTCPSCGGLAYEPTECVFCHQKYRYTKKPSGFDDIVVEYKDYKATQVYGSWGLYVEKNGKLLYHASCSKQMTKYELLDMLKGYYEKENDGIRKPTN